MCPSSAERTWRRRWWRSPAAPCVTLYPNQVGQYQLADSMHLFMTADVLVVKYSTFDVTGVDGSYEVKGVPAGRRSHGHGVPAAIMKHVERKVKVEPGKTTRVDLQLEYKKPADTTPAPSGKPSPPAPIIH